MLWFSLNTYQEIHWLLPSEKLASHLKIFDLHIALLQGAKAAYSARATPVTNKVLTDL